jgi:hypothetical protein
MATRRVKRIKRTKKQVHRARGRRKTSRHRYTRRQRGGAIITVCKKTYSGFFQHESNASGIDITYNTETHMFKIGTQPTFSDLQTFNGKKRYERAVFVLKIQKKPKEEPTTDLNWYDFVRFVAYYCHNNSDEQCAQMNNFINEFNETRDPAWPPWKDGMIVDRNGAVPGREIKTSIQTALKAIFLDELRAIANAFPSTAASGAAVAVPTCQAHVEKKGGPNSLILTQTPSCIAYINHAKLVGLQTLTSKPTYVFENFTIPLHDETVITGKLTIDLANGETQSFELILDLNGRENTNTPAFIDCMNGLKQCGTVTVTAVQRESTFFSKDKLTVNGKVELEKKDNTLFVSNFQTFVTKFAEQYKFCTTPIGQNLENAEEINRLDAGALVILINGKIKTLDITMPSDTDYKKLKQKFEEFIKLHKERRIDSTKENLDLLNRIHDGMKRMKPQTGDELAAKLEALKDD